MKFIAIILFLLSILCGPAHSQSVVGCYVEIPNSLKGQKVPFVNKLCLNSDSSFSYTIRDDMTILAMCEGSWRQTSGVIYFQKLNKPATIACNGLNLIYERQRRDDTFERGKWLDVFAVIDQDTIKLVGSIISNKKGKQILGVDKPVCLDETTSEIDIEFQSDHVQYRFSHASKANYYQLFVCYDGRTYTPLEDLPFNNLIYKNGKLLNTAGGVIFERKR